MLLNEKAPIENFPTWKSNDLKPFHQSTQSYHYIWCKICHHLWSWEFASFLMKHIVYFTLTTLITVNDNDITKPIFWSPFKISKQAGHCYQIVELTYYRPRFGSPNIDITKQGRRYNMATRWRECNCSNWTFMSFQNLQASFILWKILKWTNYQTMAYYTTK